MTDIALLGPWVRRFLLEHLVGERNLARNTQQSYRDTLRLLLPFSARRLRKPIDQLKAEDLLADHIQEFLHDLEIQRGCSVATRNQRLAAIHSLAHFIGLHSPEHVRWRGDIRAILLKRAPQSLATYLEKVEMDALLEAPDSRTALGRRDRALLLFLYNTGAWADEVAHVTISDLDLGHIPERDVSSVLIHGRGSKCRRCPLWARTVKKMWRPVAESSKLHRSMAGRQTAASPGTASEKQPAKL
jgi:integrase/recombinase XerD